MTNQNPIVRLSLSKTFLSPAEVGFIPLFEKTGELLKNYLFIVIYKHLKHMERQEAMKKIDHLIRSCVMNIFRAIKVFNYKKA